MDNALVTLSPPPEGQLMPRMGELRGWIKANTPGRCDSWMTFKQGQESYGMHGHERLLQVTALNFRFERVQDAVLFKLTWGGRS